MALKAALILVAILIATYSNSAFAYVGPGAGLSLIGSVIGLLVAVAMALGVVLFWPIRQLIRRNRKAATETPATVTGPDDNAGP